MAPFRAKIGLKGLRKGENKNYRFVSFLPGAEQKMPKKKAKKLKQLKKIPLWHHFKPKQFGKGQEREKIKIIVSFRSYRTRYRKFQKKKAEKLKKKLKKHHYGTISSQKLFGKCQESEKIKIIVSFRPYLTHNLKFQKNYQKIKKKNKK